jgi:hypothetical protein
MGAVGKVIFGYVVVGTLISMKTAPISWQYPPGNLPFWIFLWPVPVAAEAVQRVTGEYPSWTPNL